MKWAIPFFNNTGGVDKLFQGIYTNGDAPV